MAAQQQKSSPRRISACRVAAISTGAPPGKTRETMGVSWPPGYNAGNEDPASPGLANPPVPAPLKGACLSRGKEGRHPPGPALPSWLPACVSLTWARLLEGPPSGPQLPRNPQRGCLPSKPPATLPAELGQRNCCWEAGSQRLGGTAPPLTASSGRAPGRGSWGPSAQPTPEAPGQRSNRCRLKKSFTILQKAQELLSPGWFRARQSQVTRLPPPAGGSAFCHPSPAEADFR